MSAAVLFTLLVVCVLSAHCASSGYSASRNQIYSLDRSKSDDRSFVIDYEKDTFLKDGKPFRYVSGSIHYSRIPPYYWKDRLMKMYAGGLNAIQTYVTWNLHEPEPGQYQFSGQADLEGFLRTAQDAGLLVILRVGPYICGEWEMGGLPSWLFRTNPSVQLRTMDPDYIQPVDRWLSVLLPKIKPLLYANGGPVISVQVENEYGSFGCNHTYIQHLYDQFHSYLGDDVIYFSTDGSGKKMLTCGQSGVKGLYGTIDFGAGGNVTATFQVQRDLEPHGPLVNSEYYTGWLDHWGSGHAHTSTAAVTKTLDDMLKLGANVNMYMYEGGTNFGFMNGANYPAYAPVPTSYDYDAPLTEAGDVTDKYMAIRQVIGKYMKLPDVPIPPNTMKYAYGEVDLSFVSKLQDALSDLCPQGPNISTYPVTMETLKQDYGFILYRHKVQQTVNTLAPQALGIPGVRDRAYIMVNQVPQGVVYRTDKDLTVDVSVSSGSVLDILVENTGRINYGGGLNNNSRGLIANVTLSGKILSDWEIYTLPLSNVNNHMFTSLKYRKILSDWEIYTLPLSNVNNNMFTNLKYSGFPRVSRGLAPTLSTPSIYSGTFKLPNQPGFPRDSFLNTQGWTKGVVFINGFNLGRYWPAKGPQITLFVPAGVLQPYPADNKLILLELENAPCGATNELTGKCAVTFQDYPIINATTTSNMFAKPFQPINFDWHREH